GGDAAKVAEVKDILGVIGSTIIETGSLGSAHAMKALNNYVSAAGLIAACEALKIATAFGLEPDKVVAILNSSTGKNNSTENKLMMVIVPGLFNSGFTVGLVRKDLSIALKLANAVQEKTALGPTVLSAWEHAEELLGKGADHTEIIKILEEGSKPGG